MDATKEQQDILNNVLDRLCTLDKDNTLLECMLNKNVFITLCYTKLNDMLIIDKHLKPLDKVEDLVFTIQNLGLRELIELDNYLLDKVEESTKITNNTKTETVATETVADVENRHLLHFIIKGLLIGFVILSNVVMIGLILDAIINPDDNNLQVIMNIFNNYKEIAVIAIGGK